MYHAEEFFNPVIISVGMGVALHSYQCCGWGREDWASWRGVASREVADIRGGARWAVWEQTWIKFMKY